VKVLTHGEIMDGGASAFESVAKLDRGTLSLDFMGSIRADNPFQELEPHLRELACKLAEHRGSIERAVIDFVALEFCNSSGFYIIMDLVECVYRHVSGPVLVRRVEDDDWHQETLPILLNIDDEAISSRTRWEDVRGL
jgi:hypothetical protein